MCKCLNISRNSYYEWLKSKEKLKIKSRKENLKEKILNIFNESKQTYGSPRITQKLKGENINVSRSYVARLMKEEGIEARKRKKYKITTDSSHKYKIEDNKLDRNFNVNELGKFWVSDITYIELKDDWVYLTVIIDLADRKVVGWSLSEDMTYENTVQRAWLNARSNREIVKGFMFHSDRGVQYACNDFRNIFLYSSKLEQSMSRKGNCWDNAVAESFFKTLKVELIYRYKFQSFYTLYNAIYEYIDIWYNTKRIHSSIDYMTPLQREIMIKAELKIAS